MPNFNSHPNELGFLLDKHILTLKRHKLRFILLYFISVFYLSLPAFQIPLLEYNRTRISSLMEQRAIENYLLFFPSQTWYSIDDVNPLLLKGIIAMEDGSFFFAQGC